MLRRHTFSYVSERLTGETRLLALFIIIIVTVFNDTNERQWRVIDSNTHEMVFFGDDDFFKTQKGYLPRHKQLICSK